MTSAYRISRVENIGMPRNHIALHVQDAEDNGTLYHVIGSIKLGMQLNIRECKDPAASPEFVSSTFLGTLNNLEAFVAVIHEIAPPERQVDAKGKKLDPTKQYFRCGEWVEAVLATAKAKGILLENSESVQASRIVKN